jgi:hypothetical protein
MASTDPTEREEIARSGAFTMWSNVADRSERLRAAHDNSPSGYLWHARRLFGKDVDAEALSPQQWDQVAAARMAYLKAIASKATRARKLKRAQRLRDEAAAIEAAVGDAG